MARRVQTTQELKGDIDAGKTGDKVRETRERFDLGLATLGTDAEAAGTPATPREIAAAIAQETRGAPRPSRGQSAGVAQPGQPVLWIIGGGMVAVLAAIALALWRGHGGG